MKPLNYKRTLYLSSLLNWTIKKKEVDGKRKGVGLEDPTWTKRTVKETVPVSDVGKKYKFLYR
jgi:hypothetical protein